MKIYIACHQADLANAAAAALRAAGHRVVSEWHLSSQPRPASSDEAKWRENSCRNRMQIRDADVFVLIASPEHLDRTKCVPGGKFVEAGYAHALKEMHPIKDQQPRRLFTVGGVENGMLYASGIEHCADINEVIKALVT